MPCQVQEKSSFITTSHRPVQIGLDEIKIKALKTHKYDAYIIINQPLSGLEG